MPQIVLNLSPNYIPHWGPIEAVREIFQNAIDGETLNPENKMFWSYDPNKEILSVGNTLSHIDRKTLMIGETTKRDSDREIGKHGEGYKLAMLVFTRAGYKVVVKNYQIKELWTPVIRHNKELDSPVLAVDIKKFIFKSVPDHNLVFEIQGFTTELYASLRMMNLIVWPYIGKKIETARGDILLEEGYKGRIYVNGLFVCENKELEYGYNFKPQFITLDRERRLIAEFDLNWATSQLWASSDADFKPLAVDLIEKNARDTRFIQHHITGTMIRTLAYDRFVKQHGERAHPVTTQIGIEQVKKVGRFPVVVSEQMKDILIGSGKLPDINLLDKQPSPHDQIMEFFQAHKTGMNLAARKALVKVLLESKKWSIS